MTNEEIKELLQIFNDSGVGELELQRGRDRLRIRRAGESSTGMVHMHAPVAQSLAEAGVPSAAPVEKAPEADSNHYLQKSPIVGTFYDTPSPGAAPFVKVGDQVEVGQILCIIESMKLMNEIEAEIAGVIAAKLIENGRPVEYGEALFSIKPR
jgi:acetyl-CoA carboxylase biotin carboxyl carrier protein